VATNALARRSLTAVGGDAVAAGAYALGALSLAGEAAVLALGSLVVSYGHGLFGWQEGGFRTAIAIAVITEICAAILLSAALTTAAARR
jgi:energy-converting hydrogenase Eha subunit B